MFELIGGAAPAQGKYAAPAAMGPDNRVEAGLDFAQMLRQAEKEQAVPSKSDDQAREMPERPDAGAESAVAESEAREEAAAEESEDQAAEEVIDAPEPTETVVAVAVEVAPELETNEDGEGEGDTEAEGEWAIAAPARLGEEESGEEVPLDVDVEAEGDEGVPLMQAPVAEIDAGNPLELLNFSELMDPDLVVEKTPDQLIARISQAAASAATPQLQEELAETVMPQVIRSLATLVREGGAEMRLQLKPADLGEIELRVRTAEGVVRGEMMVQHPEVKQLLEDQVDRLKSALAAQGLELEGFDVNVDRDPRFAQTGEQNQRGGQPRRDQANHDVRDEPAAPVAVSVGEHEVDFTT